MTTMLQDLRDSGRGFLQTLGAMTWFLLRLLRETPSALLRFGLIWQQLYRLGAHSLLIIGISAVFVGMVLALQGYHILSQFGATESLGVMVAMTLVRELGPVLTAVLFAGRAGTSLASEIGLMRATDQLSGMEMMAVDPVKRVIVPRFLAGVIAVPLLTAIFSALGIFGGYVVGVGLLGVDAGPFWSQMNNAVQVGTDVMSGIWKSVAFGVTASLVAVYEGYKAPPTAEGVSRATTRAIVITAVAVLAINFLITAMIVGEG
ncbi:phospholipid/cholesterol/gamma-HCH transport system permease protein [Natronospira proteinivora]|uniref:Intermembrane phospholipid transport system permease protein MlaE n=1 Tax=Natronospira proteinivora TaxID=1807133 RepID=A0ABT1G830_9GAMM|nr:lipid asymmetry maintenance ABC transporter permease subunit MlaE [Natronospira proteinivora]MCP1726473.1 phospholipid/cholesterol/gamma-HCH transport system permease protein [Natronospira proteinivora]